MNSHSSQSSDNSWRPRRIRRIAKSIQDAKKVGLPFMLNAFLARHFLNETNADTGEASYPNAVRRAKELLYRMLEEAEAFCSDEDNQGSKDLKEYIHKYIVNQCEKDHPITLANTLNTVLLEFRTRQFGDLPIPSERPDEELIFISNEQLKIESSHIKDDLPKSKRRPDVVATSTSILREIYASRKDLGFEEWEQLHAQHRILEAPSRKWDWSDIYQAWEVEMDAREAPKSLPHGAQHAGQSFSACSTPCISSSRRRNPLKRPSDEQDFETTKKPRIHSPIFSHTTDTAPTHFQFVDDRYNLVPDLRCAYYAAERLSGGWHISHTTSVLLEGTKLSLRWYDTEGCIESETIDISEQTPLFVLFVMVFQRCDKQMWGQSLEDPAKVEVGDESYVLEAETRSSFDFTGRRTFGASAALLRQSTQPQTMFFKSSWMKSSDRKEPEIIGIIHDRANSLLPQEYRKMVTDHIPAVVGSKECKAESTTIIRLLIKIAGGFSDLSTGDISKQGRVRVWMVTRKLKKLHRIGPSVFWRVFWELIRCHYLLWRIGIAHNDISINNLMYAEDEGGPIGILNDYDLVSVMEPGARTPGADGYERSGTRPFMALDLLKNRDEPLKRRYRHDLESFAWRLLWEMLKQPPDWAAKSYTMESAAKSSLLVDIYGRANDIKNDWRPYFKFISMWFDVCLKHSKQMTSVKVMTRLDTERFKTESDILAFRNAAEEKKRDSEHLKPIIEAAKLVDCGVEVEVIRDSSWLDLELLGK